MDGRINRWMDGWTDGPTLLKLLQYNSTAMLYISEGLTMVILKAGVVLLDVDLCVNALCNAHILPTPS